MVEHNNLRDWDHLVVNHVGTGAISHPAQRRNNSNGTADKLRKKTRRISTMDYVTEWNLQDDENDERRK